MSTSLYAEYNISRDKYVGYDIKFILAPIIWEHDGSLSGDDVLIDKDTTFFHEDKKINVYQLLLGLCHSERYGEEANKLVKMIEKSEGGILLSLKGK
jgi:hypothetical protein